MTLNEYLQKRTQADLAKALGVHQTLVSQWVNETIRITAEKAIEIEKATNGVVTRKELRPDIFGEDAA